MSNKAEFEKWLLSLDEDYPDSDILDSVGGEYFYTTTKTLYRQFTQIAALEAKNAKVVKMAKAIIDRLENSAWKYEKHTSDVIQDLRAAVDEYEK